MTSDITCTLQIIDFVRSGVDESALREHNPDLLEFGTKNGLIRVVTPVREGTPVRVHLTGLALEKSIALRDQGNPLLGIDITAHGLLFRSELTQDQWVCTLQRLRTVKSSYHNAIADMLSFGRSHFDATFVNEAIEQLEFPLDDINHAEGITHVPRSLRETFCLTSEHYYILGIKFPTDHPSQELWAGRARDHLLSPLNLKRSIESDRILTTDALNKLTGHGSGIAVLQGLVLPFTRWTKTVGGIQQVKTWDPERQAQILRELTPIVEFALTLRATLNPTEEEES